MFLAVAHRNCPPLKNNCQTRLAKKTVYLISIPQVVLQKRIGLGSRDGEDQKRQHHNYQWRQVIHSIILIDVWSQDMDELELSDKAFKNNVVLLTGASMGIGEQLAYQLADQGAQLMLAARSADKLAEVAQECRRRGAKAEYFAADLMDESQCAQLVSHTLSTYQRIDT